jgi:GAF domain-containing protein
VVDPDAKSNATPARHFAEDVIRAAAVDLTGKALLFVGGSVVAAVALLIWQGGSVPAWVTAALLVVAAVGALVLRSRATKPLRARIGELETEKAAADDDVDVFVWGLTRHETYSKHVAQTLDALQRVVSGDISVSIPHYIEQAILEPGRDLLMEKPAENVRLSVLLPRADDPTRWSMPFAAGHSLPGKSKYDQRIVDTLSRYAHETGEAQYWADVADERGFRQNPLASAPIRSMMSLPIRQGDEILGVFNVVSSEPNAFDPAEETYVTSLGGVIAVAVSMFMKDQPDKPDSD